MAAFADSLDAQAIKINRQRIDAAHKREKD